MPLTHTKELFAKALKGKYALGAFNVNNMELIQAIVEACEEEKAPLMLQISKGARQYANPVYLKKLIEAAVSLSNIPIAIHLDAGEDDALWHAVRALPPKQRAAVLHRFLHDLAYRDIARIIGCSEAAARQNVRAGLATLREVYPS